MKVFWNWRGDILPSIRVVVKLDNRHSLDLIVIRMHPGRGVIVAKHGQHADSKSRPSVASAFKLIRRLVGQQAALTFAGVDEDA